MRPFPKSRCFGVPDEKWGERPAALIVLKAGYGKPVSEDDFRDFMQQFVTQGIISKWAVPDRFLIVDEIPKTSVGKINKKVIREKYK